MESATAPFGSSDPGYTGPEMVSPALPKEPFP